MDPAPLSRCWARGCKGPEEERAAADGRAPQLWEADPKWEEAKARAGFQELHCLGGYLQLDKSVGLENSR